MLISNWNDALIIQFGIGFQFQLEMIICLVEKSTKVYSISNLELDSNWIPIPNWNDQNVFPIIGKALREITPTFVILYVPFHSNGCQL